MPQEYSPRAQEVHHGIDTSSIDHLSQSSEERLRNAKAAFEKSRAAQKALIDYKKSHEKRAHLHAKLTEVLKKMYGDKIPPNFLDDPQKIASTIRGWEAHYKQQIPPQYQEAYQLLIAYRDVLHDIPQHERALQDNEMGHLVASVHSQATERTDAQTLTSLRERLGASPHSETQPTPNTINTHIFDDAATAQAEKRSETAAEYREAALRDTDANIIAYIKERQKSGQYQDHVSRELLTGYETRVAYESQQDAAFLKYIKAHPETDEAREILQALESRERSRDLRLALRYDRTQGDIKIRPGRGDSPTQKTQELIQELNERYENDPEYAPSIEHLTQAQAAYDENARKTLATIQEFSKNGDGSNSHIADALERVFGKGEVNLAQVKNILWDEFPMAQEDYKNAIATLRAAGVFDFSFANALRDARNEEYTTRRAFFWEVSKEVDESLKDASATLHRYRNVLDSETHARLDYLEKEKEAFDTKIGDRHTLGTDTHLRRANSDLEDRATAGLM